MPQKGSARSASWGTAFPSSSPTPLGRLQQVCVDKYVSTDSIITLALALGHRISCQLTGMIGAPVQFIRAAAVKREALSVETA